MTLARTAVAAGLLALTLSGCEIEHQEAPAVPPPPAVRATGPTVDSRPEQLGITPGVDTFAADCDQGEVLNYWPADQWAKAVDECRQLDGASDAVEDAVRPDRAG